MRRTPPIIIAAALLLTAASGPKVLPPLPAGTIDPALILPAPPADGSAEAAAELAELHRIQAARTADQVAHAKSDDATKDVSIFNSVLGVDLLKMPATAALFAMVRAEEKRDADVAKDLFRRKRPWIGDPSLESCSRDDDPLSSYPSGHTTMGFSMGAILARLAPSRAPAIMARARDYAHSRLICEMHFHEDLIAGQTLGMIVAERLMQDPAFRHQFDAAKMEIAAAAR